MRFQKPSTRSPPTYPSASTTSGCRRNTSSKRLSSRSSNWQIRSRKTRRSRSRSKNSLPPFPPQSRPASRPRCSQPLPKQCLPAYSRFARFLQVAYIPAGRTEPGISSLPDGAKYYQFLIRRTTTTNLTADQIHQIGLDEVKKDEAEMLAIAQKLGFQDLKSFQASLKTNTKLKATFARAAPRHVSRLSRPMQAKLPQLFGRLPKAPFEVVPVPDFLEKTSAPAYYEAGTPDGSRPGRLFIDTYNATDRDLYQVEDHRVSRRTARPPPANLHRPRTPGRPRIPQVRRLFSLR